MLAPARMDAESTKREDDRRRDPRDAGAALLLVAGEGLLATHALVAPSLILGRAPECDLVVDSATLSRRHACVRCGPPVTIQDLGSFNGTRIDGVLHRGGDPVPLAVGQTFHIGKLSFMLLDAPRAPSLHSELGHRLRVVDPGQGRVSADVREIARSGINVLVLGETGVGKEVLAETLHACSERRGPLVRISCAALSEMLIERDLFGHDKGAFAGADESKLGLIASAHRGTLLLDEVGELSARVQAKLLRVIETKEVLPLGALQPRTIDVRFIASSNRDLPAEAARGRFRADLLYRLGVTLEIPPLRDRAQLVAPLAWQFVEEAERAAGRAPQPLTAAVLRLLEHHAWPGNVRELKAAVQRALLLARGRALGPQHFALDAVAPSPRSSPGATSSPAEGDDGERARIVAALEECAGNQTRVARRLGMSRTTLVHKIALYRIPRPRK